MIKLIDLLYEGDESSDNEDREIWLTDLRKWGARNTLGQVRYFSDREKAVSFARGNTKPSRPKKQKAKKHDPYDRKQKYDDTIS